MPRFCANLSMMFNEHPFLDRFARRGEAGFKAVEFLFPYDHPAADIQARLDGQRAGAGAVQHAARRLGDGRARHSPACPAARRSSATASSARWTTPPCSAPSGCTAWPGCCRPGLRPGTAASLYAANLAWACEQAQAAGVLVVIEPINHRDMPGFFLNTTGQAAAVVEAIGRDRLAILFDLYHCQVTEGDVTSRLANLLPLDRPHPARRRSRP